jgi:hypothetical protein
VLGITQIVSSKRSASQPKRTGEEENFTSNKIETVLRRKGCLFLRSHSKRIHMGHDHDHDEAKQNEIGGPVVFALFLFALVIAAIYFMG